MPRGPRIAFENSFYHIFNRGTAKQKIFIKPADYNYFLTKLELLKTKKLFDHLIYAYVLIPNHFHLLVETRKTPLAKIMSSLSTGYSMYFNRTNHRVGPVFQNRFKSKLVKKDAYFLGAMRYILINPVEAGLVNELEDYPWSSYQELFGKSEYSIIDQKEVKRLLGDEYKDQNKFRQFLLDGVKKFEYLQDDYSFTTDIQGEARFSTLAQKKYYRRKKRN